MKSTRQLFKQAKIRIFLLFSMIASLSQATALVNLGKAGNFTVLAKTGISATGTTSIVGDIGLSPAAATFITGFGLIMDSTNQFSTSSLIAGRAYASDYAAPTPAKLTTAISDMQTAYTDAAGRAPDVTELGSGTLANKTLVPGVYKWSGNLNITTDLVLAGPATGVWIFEIAGNLDIASGKHVVLSGGALAANIFWQVAGQATLQTTSVCYGNILCQTAIVLNTGATLNGRALAQSAVTLDANHVVSEQYSGANPPTQGKTFAYPSPARGSEINIVYLMAEAGAVDLRIYNDRGDLVARDEQEKASGVQKSQVPISQFAPGVYLYKVVLTYASGSKESLETQKFTVKK
ncbi:MAG: ice-binding family protein [candidate division FCPU426 bacterium]